MGQGDWTLETAPSGKGIIKAHSTISNNFLHILNINKRDNWDITKPKLILDHSYTITYPTASLTEVYKNTLNSDIIEASTHGICCFTDGSKTEHGTGGGFVISDTSTETITEHSFKIEDYCTVFQAGTAAIKHAAEELITFKNQQITFWSDSLSALQALPNKTHNNKSITDCLKALTKLADENTVKLKWIKAHTGHWGQCATGSKILTEPEPDRIGIILAGTGPEPDRITSQKKLTGFDRIDRIGRIVTGFLKPL